MFAFSISLAVIFDLITKNVDMVQKLREAFALLIITSDTIKPLRHSVKVENLLDCASQECLT